MCGWWEASSANPSATLSRIRAFQARAWRSVASSGSTSRSTAVRSPKALCLEDGGPVVLPAHDRPTDLLRPREGRLGASAVRELALVVVVRDEQRERRALEHLDVHVGVAAREDGQPPGLGEDVLGLARTHVHAAQKLPG